MRVCKACKVEQNECCIAICTVAQMFSVFFVHLLFMCCLLYVVCFYCYWCRIFPIPKTNFSLGRRNKVTLTLCLCGFTCVCVTQTYSSWMNTAVYWMVFHCTGWSMTVLELCKKYCHEGVVAIDLAGDESLNLEAHPGHRMAYEVHRPPCGATTR